MLDKLGLIASAKCDVIHMYDHMQDSGDTWVSGFERKVYQCTIFLRCHNDKHPLTTIAQLTTAGPLMESLIIN